jgi:hypothetical protein
MKMPTNPNDQGESKFTFLTTNVYISAALSGTSVEGTVTSLGATAEQPGAHRKRKTLTE